jgi:hypothetical protein
LGFCPQFPPLSYRSFDYNSSEFTKLKFSRCDSKLTKMLKPSFKAAEENAPGAPKIGKLIDSLHMLKNPEGGWFVETDPDPLRIPNPFPLEAAPWCC